jgi:hypothetical protein
VIVIDHRISLFRMLMVTGGQKDAFSNRRIQSLLFLRWSLFRRVFMLELINYRIIDAGPARLICEQPILTVQVPAEKKDQHA